MSRVHPASASRSGGEEETREERRESVWTVWKRSSMAFQGTDGFSIYDGKGRLAFRVENYERKHKCFAGELVLMDGEGRPLMALRPQIMSMHDRWIGFKCEDGGNRTQIFSVRRRSVLQSCDEAQVFMESSQSGASCVPEFTIEGCFRRRECKIFNNNGDKVAQISPKKANNSVTLGDDVFCLVVQPTMDAELVMAFLVALDRIC